MEKINPEILKTWYVQEDTEQDEKYTFVAHEDLADGFFQVSIHEINGDYEVRTYAEARTSGPCETVETRVESLDEAIKIAEAECNLWEQDLAEWRNWRKQQKG